MNRQSSLAEASDDDNLHYNILTILAGILCIIIISEFGSTKAYSQQKAFFQAIQLSNAIHFFIDNEVPTNSTSIQHKCTNK